MLVSWCGTAAAKLAGVKLTYLLVWVVVKLDGL